MVRIRLLNGSAAGQVFELPPGDYRVGRAADNGFQIEDPSVEAHHCEWKVTEDTLFVRDLGSTQGTCVDGQLVEASPVSRGQRIRIGKVEMQFEPVVGSGPGVRVRGLAGTARYAARPAPAVEAAKPRSYWQALPQAIAYPLRGRGLYVLLGGAVFYSLIEFLQGFLVFIGILVAVASGGYLYSYVQSVLVTCAQGYPEPPGWPEVSDFWTDAVQPWLQGVALVLICFAPVIVLSLWPKLNELTGGGYFPQWPEGWSLVFWAALAISGLYFPMALLGVAVADSLSGMNPFTLVPSICCVAGQYLVTCAFIGIALALQEAIDDLLSQIPVDIITGPLSWFSALYLLLVCLRLLGMVYYTSRHRLRWFPE